jgi:hypothetical protein
MQTKNADIAGLVARIQRFRRELIAAVSAGVASFRASDLDRLRSYVSALTRYKEWVVSQPELDLPFSHPTVHEVAVQAGTDGIENEDVVDVVRLLDTLSVELLGGQSKDLASGLGPHDATRFDSVLQKVTQFIDGYVTTATPLDLPESATDLNGRSVSSK